MTVSAVLDSGRRLICEGPRLICEGVGESWPSRPLPPRETTHV
jgi:hypothetical protein